MQFQQHGLGSGRDTLPMRAAPLFQVQTPHSYETLEQEYSALLREIDSTQQFLRNAVSRYNELKQESDMYQNAAASSSRVQDRFSQLSDREAALVEKNRFLSGQIDSAKQLYQKACEERANFSRQADTMNQRPALEEAFLGVRRKMNGFNPQLSEDAELLRAALGEQRYETYLLQSHLDAVKQVKETVPVDASVKDQNPVFDGQLELLALPHAAKIDLRDVLVPVERGKLRFVTGPRGDGLKKLRDTFQVMAYVVTAGDNVGVKIHGHAHGVDRCAEEVKRMLRGY